jgi:hypothetical protein
MDPQVWSPVLPSMRWSRAWCARHAKAFEIAERLSSILQIPPTTH